VDDRRFDTAQQFETHDAMVRGVQEGRVRAVNLDTLPSRQEPEASPVHSRRSPELSLSTKVPEQVMQQLRRRYAETGITIRNQILLALKAAGLEISDNEIQDDRKRPR
jgi:hypothetical protein